MIPQKENSPLELDPLITVIVPVFNVEEYLERCITALLNQSYKNIEVYLIDDGSKDSSGAICDCYAQSDSRVKVIHQANAGVSAARNAGLRNAKGEWICFVDGDDYVDWDMILHLYQAQQRDGADVAQCGYYVESEKDRTTFLEDSGYHYYEQQSVLLQLLLNKMVSFSIWNKLYRREVLQGVSFTNKYCVAEDLLFNYHVFKKATKLAVDNRPMYHYLVREGSCMHAQFQEKHMQTFAVLQEILADLQRCYLDEHEVFCAWKRQLVIASVIAVDQVLSEKTDSPYYSKLYVMVARWIKPWEIITTKIEFAQKMGSIINVGVRR